MVKNATRIARGGFVEDRPELGVPAYVYPYRAPVAGGLVGGAAKVVPALANGVLSGYGPWYPVNLVAATVFPHLQGLGPQALARFDPLYLGVGLAIHLVVATMLGFLFAVLLPALPGRPELWALIVGPLLWLGATVVALPMLNPIMSQLLDWPSFALANLVFGLVMGTWVAHTPKIPAS